MAALALALDGSAASAQAASPEAVVALERAVAAEPADLEARCDLARALAWSRRYPESETQYQLILSSRPTHREALLGLARLRGYQERFADALSIVERGLAAHPADREFIDERLRLEGAARRLDYDRPRRFTARAGAERDDYSFSTPGSRTEVAVQDRGFRGWNVAGEAAWSHRFGLDDVELGLGASRRIPGTKAYLGASIGGATRHVLLPALRAAVDGGLALGRGLELSAEGSFRHYDEADVTLLRPTLTIERRGVRLAADYSVSAAAFSDGRRSGALSSYRGRLSWESPRRLRPWLSYARTKEAFEAGVRGIASFSADHYGLGAAVRARPELELNLSYHFVQRLAPRRQVQGFGLGAAYSWGRMPSK